jgi:O-methyltransferase domain
VKLGHVRRRSSGGGGEGCSCGVDGGHTSEAVGLRRGERGAVAGVMEEDIPWRHWSRVIDVGGAFGSVLACVLNRYPHMTGVLFDLPQVPPPTILRSFLWTSFSV